MLRQRGGAAGGPNRRGVEDRAGEAHRRSGGVAGGSGHGGRHRHRTGVGSAGGSAAAGARGVRVAAVRPPRDRADPVVMWLRWWLRYLHAARRLRVARYSGSALAVVWAEREM